MNVVLTITKYKSDMQTVESTRQSDKYSKTTTVTLDVWGKLTISADDFLPVKSVRRPVTVTIDTPLTEGNFTLTVSDKLRLYSSEIENPFGQEAGVKSMTWSATISPKTYYVVSDDSPSGKMDDQKLTVTYSGTNVESVTRDLTVYELKVDAPNKTVQNSGGLMALPIMFNDDHDCGKEYTANWNCDTSCPNKKCPDDTHRELEPVWDYLYIGNYADDDLVAVDISFEPKDMTGTVKVKPRGTNIRVWKNVNKGDKNSILSEQSYNISELSKKFYIEGINIGSDSLTAEYKSKTGSGLERISSLLIEVVSLIEKQNGKREIINANMVPINFTVDGGDDFNGKFTWTVPNHKFVSSLKSDNSISVSYGETGADATLLENNEDANRRFETTVSVSIDGKLQLNRKIRVAQKIFHGSEVASTLSGRRTEVPGLIASLPKGFADTELPDNKTTLGSQKWFEEKFTGEWYEGNPPKLVTINNKRLQYGPNDNTGHQGVTVSYGKGNNLKIYALFILPSSYNLGMKKEDIKSVVLHENHHVKQQIAIKDGNTNWRKLDDYFSKVQDYLTFLEADAYLQNFKSEYTSWLLSRISLEQYKKNYYDPAEIIYANLKNDTTTEFSKKQNTLNAMKTILQSIYNDIPFSEMKNNKYYPCIRPPRYIKID
jgi:hypothetical protein